MIILYIILYKKEKEILRKTILITGASRGIGRSLALSLDDPNLNIVINYEKEHGLAEEAVEIIKAKGINAICIQADVADRTQVDKMFRIIEETYGGVDILVNNAGIAFPKLSQDVTYEEWDRIFAVNVNGMFNTTKHCLDYMISKKLGCIVNVSSIWGQTGGSMETHYSATKGAIISYSKSLAMELAPSGIRVNVVAPGAVDTDMLNILPRQALESFAKEVPLQRLGHVNDIAEAIKFLISDKASYITGQVIAVNGGYYN